MGEREYMVRTRNIWVEFDGGKTIFSTTITGGKPAAYGKPVRRHDFRWRGWVKSLGSGLEVGFNALPHCHPDEIGRVVCVRRKKKPTMTELFETERK